MEDEEGGSTAPGSGGNGGVRRAETLLRLIPVALCVVALLIMLKNSQNSDDLGSISYSDLGPFKYLVHANGICAGYSLLTAVVAAMPRPTTLPRAWTFFLLDQMLTYIILGAGALATEVVYLSYKGNNATAWGESCGSFSGFCRKATASVAITFIVSLCYAGISLISSYRLFTKYDPPLAIASASTYTTTTNNNNKGVEFSTI
ncbi:hypothetical protein DM860_017431 [Cuscuta australis]|uniref:CASP-like protein n=1 Tax=Cuscuta australis TaxID=267555 RepID=A0A328DEU4_9ASTE|nr:hypothetical protein DM860_017431 [Cuscuta australis]